MRKISIIAMSVLLSAAGVLSGASTASAAPDVRAPYYIGGQCTGTPVPGFPKVLRNRAGDPAGLVRLTYANGGAINCASVSDETGGSHYMSVSLRRQDLSYSGRDSGTYSTYAGGVRVSGAAGECVYVNGTLNLGPDSIDRYSFSSGAVGCN